MKKTVEEMTPQEYLNAEGVIEPKILIGDVIEKLRELPDKCVDIIITSPPYWKQRDYEIKGQIGQESTPDEYVQKIVEVGDELKRVLKDTGSYFLNVGDKYVNKDLQMIPFKIAIEMQKRGWVIRNVIVWYKPNHMPSSVKDRLSNVWEPIFFFVKSTGKYYSQEYFANLDEIRIPQETKEELEIDLPLVLSEDEYLKRKNEIESKLQQI
ncbi:MAG: site-specific DNA-methyltransferase, partial [Candidatus Aenigmatarchaeota archaeon]